MAEIAGYPQGIGAVSSAVPTTEMVPNQNFMFPRVEATAGHRRLKSMTAALPRTVERAHQRGGSALPTFTFNANDTSGLTGDDPGEEVAPTVLPAPTTPSRGSHKRNTSEYVGGLGLTGAISSSPTRGTALSVPQRQHRSRHSRSQLTLSSHDLSSIMSPPEAQPRLSSSLPNTPLEHPSSDAMTGTCSANDQVLGSPLDDCAARPPSRPRVEFSDSVEYIPRPLSTISSDTGSSMSTVRGHSVNNSISSMLSLSNQSPPHARARATSLETTMEDEPQFVPKSSLEVSRRIEKEGQWLRNGSVTDTLGRPFTEPTSQPPRLTFAGDSVLGHQRAVSHRKRRSVSNNLGFDRRKSEPVMGSYAGEPSRLSALSLQEQIAVAPYSFERHPLEMDRRSSSRKIKDWAVSKLRSRKSKEYVRPTSGYMNMPTVGTGVTQTVFNEPVMAETNLDAVFSMDAPALPTTTAHAQPVFEVRSPRFDASTSSRFEDYEDCGTMLDLDAALGPFKTPQLSTQRPRRELHSSRGTKDFVGPGGHYSPSATHRRTESAPMLTAFEQGRTGTPPQPEMADVFEEEEEEEVQDLTSTSPRPNSTHSAQDDEAGMGVQIVDSDVSASSSTPSLSLDDGLRIQRADWEPERPSTSYCNLTSRLSTPILDRRSSVIEDTIFEESSPTEPTIVEFHEEPRAQSLTKSSDSSETPTILAAQTDMPALPAGQQPSETPNTYQSSAFSTPDLAHRQNSFDDARIGTSASSIADTRTMSSCTTGEPSHDVRVSSDDVPSLTSSRSTMISTMHVNTSRRDVSGARTPLSGTASGMTETQTRRKRDSIQSLSQLVGGSFGSRSNGSNDGRPQTAADAGTFNKQPKKKEHRLSKLMFWKSKHRQASGPTIS